VSRILRNLRPRTWLERARNAQTDLHDIKSSSGQTVSTTAQIHDELASQRQALHELRGEVAAILQQLSGISESLTEQRQRLLLALRMVRDDDAGARRQLLDLRSRPEYHDAFKESEPLVSVVIPTYNNWAMLRDRSLPSVLAQSYENWECVVVGDCAPDETRAVVDSFGDDRLRFENLPYRGPYPDNKTESWMISGTPPWNAGIVLARGRWIAPHADDDALRPQALERLLQHAQQNQAEVAYGYIEMIHPDNTVTRLGEFPPRYQQWGMQGSLLHAGLTFMPSLPSDWVFEIPNDMSLLERMLRIGVRFSMLEETMVDYYPSILWTSGRLG
jgi:glycosyl transferase family 2